jgi:hypothetical protein
MKFIVARTPLQRDLLDSCFESLTFGRNAQTRELTIIWRPVRCLAVLIGLPLFFYIASVVAVTLWIQEFAPGIKIAYSDVANPARWGRISSRWKAFQDSAATPLDASQLAAAADASDAYARAAARVNSGAPNAPATRSSTVYTLSDNPIVASVPYGPLLTQYFTHNGGTIKLLGILSIQIHGTVTMQSGETLNFTMVKKPPGKIRINMRDNVSNQEATVLTDGQDSWKWSGDPYQSGVHPTPPDEAAALVREAMYCDIPIEIIHNPHALREIPRQLGEDEHFNYVQTILNGGMRALIFLNPDTWRADRIQIDYDQAGVPCSYTILVRDWMTVSGISEPSLIDVYVNGSHLLQCKFDSITYNPGAYDVLFEPPPDAVKPAAATAPPASPSSSPPPASNPPASPSPPASPPAS